MEKSFKKSLSVGLIAVTATAAFAFACPKCGNPHHTCSNVSAIAANVYAGQQAAQELNITAKAAFLLEANSGKVLFTKDENKRLPIASMVKITTLAVIYDAMAAGEISMGDKVLVSREASGMGGSQAFLDFDAEYPVEDLIKSIIIASANDSCVAMAEHIAGSETEFVNRMNALANKLGMENTNYVNCTGLPAAENYSCAADVAKVYQYLMRSPFYGYKTADGTPINKIWMYDLTHPSGRVTGLTNTNKHVRFYNDCVGGKTGFTGEAGHCITVAANRGNMKPVAVIIGASASDVRFAESASLLNHVFTGYENKLVVDKNQKIGTVRVKKSAVESVDVYAKENYFDLVKRGEKNALPSVNVQLNETITAPNAKENAVGKIIVTDEGAVVREIDIICGADIDKLGLWDAVKIVGKNFKIAR
jgi:D-alanyl-D-alanine carboxypeptidase (penicillin-binding protein 5/6)